MHFFVSEPTGKPRVTAAHNTSSTSLYLSWQPPEANSIHGEFLGYRISYRPRDVGAAKAVEVPIENPKATVSDNIIFDFNKKMASIKKQGPNSTDAKTTPS